MIINRGNQLSSHSSKKYLFLLKGSKIQSNFLFQTISAVLPIFSMCLANRQVLVKHSIDKNMESRYPLLIFSNARQIIHRRCSSAHEHLPASLVRSNPQFVVEYLLPRRLLNYRETFRPQFALIFPHIEPVFREPSFSSTSPSPLSPSVLLQPSIKQAFNLPSCPKHTLRSFLLLSGRGINRVLNVGKRKSIANDRIVLDVWTSVFHFFVFQSR